jgi:DegV family protein with EDD domain
VTGVILDRSTTAVVVDSTADLPDGLAHDPNVTVVPLTVFFGDKAYLDGVDLKPEQFYEKLAAAPQLPRTSQPAPAVWTEVYTRLLQRYQRVYSVHLSAELSGTFQTAHMVAEGLGGDEAGRVQVVDSRLATGGFALLVDRLMERVDRGIPEDEFRAYLEYFLRNNTFVFLPTTLDYLYRGGRIGRASHLVGSLLNIKPVLMIDDGVADVFKKVRGVRQALETMRDCLLERTEPGSDVYANLAHGMNPPLLEQLRELIVGISDRRIHLRPSTVVGAVIGTYAGPGAVGIGFIQE